MLGIYPDFKIRACVQEIFLVTPTFVWFVTFHIQYCTHHLEREIAKGNCMC